VTVCGSSVDRSRCRRRVNRYHGGGWRVSFLFEPQSGDPIELRLFLRKEEQILTETWTWRWAP